MGRLPGIDNRAMHTSYKNTIALKDSPEITAQKVEKMYTDPTRIHASDPGHVIGNPVFTYLDIFVHEKAKVAELKEKYRAGKISDVAVKKILADTLNEYLAPLRERRREWESHKDDLRDILLAGTKIAQEKAHATLEEVYQRMGLRFQ